MTKTKAWDQHQDQDTIVKGKTKDFFQYENLKKNEKMKLNNTVEKENKTK